MKVVPLPSERWTTTISLFGSFTPGLSAAIAWIVPLGDRAQKNAGHRVAGVKFRSCGHAREIVVATTAPSTVGKCRTGIFSVASADSVVGHRHVGRAEIHRPGGQLPDAAAGPDGLIVDLYVRDAVLWYSSNHF